MKTMKTLTEKRFFEWHEDDVAVTLRNKEDTVGALCSDDHKGPNRQYVGQDKLISEIHE